VAQEEQPMSTIREAWESYRHDVMPEHVSPVQELETCRAFYAGAAALLGTMMSIGDAESMSLDAGSSILEDLSFIKIL